MGYQEALEAAGAKVIDSLYTGSYQGSWGSIVELHGIKGLVTGAYGSCSGCDSFQAEFDYDTKPKIKDGKYYINGNTWDEEDAVTYEVYETALAAYNKKLSDFGAYYLKQIFNKQDIENKIASFKDDDWFDTEEKELYDWAIKFF